MTWFYVKVFNGQFNNWTEFKKAMYEERKTSSTA